MLIETLNFEQFGGVIIGVAIFVGATATALWISMTVWAYRDMRTRSRDSIASIMAASVVALFNLPGLVVYLILRPQITLAEQYERALEEEALLQDIESKQTCPGCGHNLQDNWRMCPYCHTRIRKPCDSCGSLLELAWSICPYCETVQTGSAESSRTNARV